MSGFFFFFAISVWPQIFQSPGKKLDRKIATDHEISAKFCKIPQIFRKIPQNFKTQMTAKISPLGVATHLPKKIPPKWPQQHFLLTKKNFYVLGRLSVCFCFLQ
jgi:hypothetical protein